MSTPIQQAAIEYIEAGLRLLALTGKKPNGRVHGENWSWEASFWSDTPPTDADRVGVAAAFAESKGTTGIAILIPPGYYVADVDTERAAALLLKLGYQHDADSVVAKTKNGLHIWFLAPGADKNRWLGDGQDPNPGRTLLFKGFGGYVVAPPSLHLDAAGVVDGVYEWVAPLSEGGRCFMPHTLPEAAQEQFTMADQYAAAEPDKTQMTHFTTEPGGPWWAPTTMHYGLEGLERAIENAADGNQNNVIHWAAMTAREEGVPLTVSMDRLLKAAEKGGHPRHRAHDTIKGAYKRAPRG